MHDLRSVHNREFHRGNEELSYQEFWLLWVETKDMLQSHGFDITLVDDLKTGGHFLQQQYTEVAFLIFLGAIYNFLMISC